MTEVIRIVSDQFINESPRNPFKMLQGRQGVSWNTWLMSMTKMKNLSDATLLEMHDRIHHMMSAYRESLSLSGFLARSAEKELDKCEEELVRVGQEMKSRGLL